MSSEAAFRKLDPILRMLLSSIDSYRQACNNDDDTPNEERILGILRVQVRIMDNLEQAIQQVAEMYGSGVLQAQMDYILLPLRLLLQASDWAPTPENVSPIRQSAIWKSTETAARVMNQTITLVGSLISVKQSLECLTACTFPLATNDKLEDNKGGLDRGDDCMRAVLNCIDTLMESASKHVVCQEDVWRNLVARISFSCTTILSRDVSLRKKSQQVQVQALQTLDALLNEARNTKMWQSYFPGIFATLCGLLLSELRLAPAQATPTMSSGACHTMSKLLCATLTTAKKEKSDDPTDVWRDIQQMAENPVQSNMSEFMQEVYSRLPAPLILLLNLLPTATSPTLRQAAPELCHAILVETRPVWEAREETSNVLQSAIECCIALSRDKDGRVVSAAKSTIADYRLQAGRHDVDNSIGPRVLQLIEELPALARSGRETELRGRINVISGYLMLGGSLRSSLSSMMKEIQTSLAVLFDVDFDSIQYAPRVETTDAWDVWQPDRCRFRFMMDDTAKSAREMAQSLGGTLGQKAASSFVDECVADVLEACVATTQTLSGPRQVDWLHEWIGCIVNAELVLVGAFEEPQLPPMADENAEPDGTKEESVHKPCRQDRKRLRRLNALAGAILPIITSAPLWTLPTVLDNVANKPEPTKTLTITEVQENLEIQAPIVSASAMKGNAAMVCSLIGLVNSTVDLLGNSVETYLQVILFPLCEKASSHNHCQVQRTASLALHQVASACDMSSTRKLIRQNFDYLFGAMLSRIRRAGGQQTGGLTSFPTSIPSIAKVVLQSAIDSGNTALGGVRSERSLSDETCVSYVIELVDALVGSFDSNLIIMNKNPSLQESTSMELIEVFDSSLSFIASTFGLCLERVNDPFADVPVPDRGVDCMAALEPFRSLKSDGLTAKEGFEKIRNETRNEGGRSDDVGEAHPVIEIANGELDFVDLALARCSFALSSPSLQVEMASCDGMQHAFALLGCVAMYTKPKEDEPNGPKTAVLRHIGSSWPSIISRFRALSSTVISCSRGKTVSIRLSRTDAPSSAPQDVSTQTIFLSKLFELVASMCEVSEDFLVGRIKEQVWPVTAELLDMYLQEEKTVSRNQLGYNGLVLKDSSRKKPFMTEREKLLFSILEFLSRIFFVPQCGRGLSGLIPSAGTIVLPFLASEGELRARTMRALKTMMLIDCDALWRPLLKLSGRSLPPRPFGPQSSSVVVQETHDRTTLLESAAAELIEFIDTLPEQSLDIQDS